MLHARQLIRRRLPIGLLAAVLLSSSIAGGCLRARVRSAEPQLRDAPAMPKANFGRPVQPLGQLGTDPRTREIEKSLGVGEATARQDARE